VECERTRPVMHCCLPCPFTFFARIQPVVRATVQWGYRTTICAHMLCVHKCALRAAKEQGLKSRRYGRPLACGLCAAQTQKQSAGTAYDSTKHERALEQHTLMRHEMPRVLRTSKNFKLLSAASLHTV
jgi:hypothetical protein